mmetsp:Transcript_61446/g.84428  ORF Transcript_61446/g.84428 Transcript_61446/m.84428 type:complete len:214 (+) Transcript_61446:1471-2112(+)
MGRRNLSGGTCWMRGEMRGIPMTAMAGHLQLTQPKMVQAVTTTTIAPKMMTTMKRNSRRRWSRITMRRRMRRLRARVGTSLNEKPNNRIMRRESGTRRRSFRKRKRALQRSKRGVAEPLHGLGVNACRLLRLLLWCSAEDRVCSYRPSFTRPCGCCMWQLGSQKTEGPRVIPMKHVGIGRGCFGFKKFGRCGVAFSNLPGARLQSRRAMGNLS